MISQFVFLIQNLQQHPELLSSDVGIIQSEQNDDLTVHFLRINQHIQIHKSLVQEFEISQTGDRHTQKVCDRCYKLLDTETHFENNRLKKGDVITKRPSCRDCRKIKNGKNISAKDRQVWENNRPAHGSLFTCPICEKTTIVGITKIVLDHNHHTGQVRGWLCESCNTGIGRFDDNPELVERAKAWLSR